jgi:hypothetical protein
MAEDVWEVPGDVGEEIAPIYLPYQGVTYTERRSNCVIYFPNRDRSELVVRSEERCATQGGKIPFLFVSLE